MTETDGLSRKKRMRAGHRSSATRILAQVEGELTGDTPDVERLDAFRTTLTEKKDILRGLDTEILELVTEEELETEIGQSDEYNERIHLALVRINKALEPRPTPTPTTTRPRSRPTTPVEPDEPRETVDAREPATPEPPADRTREEIPSVASTPTGTRVKLPKIVLPRFSGNVMQWPSFWDSYNSSIHRNETLSEVDKFNYLRSLLERTAYEAISGLTLSAVNYQEAIEILQKRFGDKRMIVAKHMETLLHVEVVTSDHNLRELRKLYDTVEAHTRSLRALGVDPKSYGVMLSSVLLSKLPPDLRLLVSRRMSTEEDLDLDGILELFEQELMARERSVNPSQRPARRQERGRQSTLFAGTQEPKCCYCDLQHSSSNCTSVGSISERKHLLRSNGRCYNCLRKGHLVRACRSQSKCQNCRGKHHTSICEKSNQPDKVPSLAQKKETPTTPLDPAVPAFVPTANSLCCDLKKTVLLQTAIVLVQNPARPEKFVELRLLLDSGSQRSYLSERAKEMLGLETIREQALSIATFGSKVEQLKVCPVVEVQLQLKGYTSMQLILCVVPTICEPLACQPISVCVQQHETLNGLDLADQSDGQTNLQVDLLIGSDYYWDIVTGSICKVKNGPTAVHTKVGWVLSGPTPSNGSDSCSVNLTTTHVLRAESIQSEQFSLDEQLRAFWDLETLGIKEKEPTLYDNFMKHVVFRSGRYRVSLPWKEFHDPLPDNFALSVKRLHGLLRKLRQDPDILREYDRTIREQLKNGIIEAVPRDANSTKVHYLPHHAVLRRDKTTTKLRIVYDASASSEGPSLNDCLQKGPRFNQVIFDLLIRFRSYRIALTGDVEKAFLMIEVENQDRDVLRFVWIDDIHKEEPQLQEYRFTRVVFGVTSSPFLLNATIKFHLESFSKTDQTTVERLLQSTYVDDIVAGADTEDEAYQLYTRAKELFRCGGFNLRKFLTNSSELQQRIDLNEGTLSDSPVDVSSETYAQATLGSQSLGASNECKILGVTWDHTTDCLRFDVISLAQIADNLSPTKRNLVSLIGRFYDPFGILSPVIVRFKLLFQKLCQAKIDWDESLPPTLLQEWRELIATLHEGTPIIVPRCYFNGLSENATATLCGFCDASTQAYAAVVYLKLETATEARITLVAAKTRIAPLQAQTIPRLELLSALLLSRLMVSVMTSLKPTLYISGTHCYTDSQVALYWIKGTTKEWKPFVQNRVSEIRRNVHSDLWGHCPGKSNPADLPSRGLSVLETSVSQLWRHGPEWLCCGTDPQLEMEPLHQMPKDCLCELKGHPKTYIALTCAATANDIGELIDIKRFSTLHKLLRVTMQVLKAIQLFSRTHCDDQESALLSKAELLWVHNSQRSFLSRKEFSSYQRQFRLFLDDKDVWRCEGRLTNVELPYEVKNPVLLPREHPFTELQVLEAHNRVFHDGVKETLTELRSKFWIPRARSLVRRLIHQCVQCRRFEGRPFKPPPPPPLPRFRVVEDPAFTHTGVDFAGPLQVRTCKDSTQKMWICLFTCYVTRAIHLEVVPDQTTQAFIRCLKRFCSRRGVPSRFISDNGKTFKSAAKYLEGMFTDSSVIEHLHKMSVEWLFNVERAPWWGGAFERMIRSTKRCLYKAVGRAQFGHDELVTVLTEIEAILNSRPLSYVSAEDTDEPLTPSHLLIGRRILNLPDHLSRLEDPDDEDYSPDSSHFARRMKHLSNILNHFWNRWRSEYLGELREIHAHTAKNQSKTEPSHVSVGNIVIVYDEHLPRGLWKLGRIVSVMKGRDGQIRGATVKTTSSDGRTIHLNRPIQRLYPLEVQAQSDASADTSTLESDASRQTDTSTPVRDFTRPRDVETSPDRDGRRSRRAAALQADDRRRACDIQLTELVSEP